MEDQELDDRLRNVQLAREVLTEANQRLWEVKERREVAVNAMVDYALAAYVAGHKMEDIMEACDVKARPAPEGMPEILAQLAGIPTGDSQQDRITTFAQWLGRCVAERVMEKAKDEGLLED